MKSLGILEPETSVQPVLVQVPRDLEDSPASKAGAQTQRTECHLDGFKAGERLRCCCFSSRRKQQSLEAVLLVRASPPG